MTSLQSIPSLPYPLFSFYNCNKPNLMHFISWWWIQYIYRGHLTLWRCWPLHLYTYKKARMIISFICSFPNWIHNVSFCNSRIDRVWWSYTANNEPRLLEFFIRGWHQEGALSVWFIWTSVYNQFAILQRQDSRHWWLQVQGIYHSGYGERRHYH